MDIQEPLKRIADALCDLGEVFVVVHNLRSPYGGYDRLAEVTMTFDRPYGPGQWTEFRQRIYGTDESLCDAAVIQQIKEGFKVENLGVMAIPVEL